MKNQKILVTGASGYIALHTLLALQTHQLTATLRSHTHESFVRSLLPNLTIVHADLLQPLDWPKAVEGMDIVVHIASPIPVVNPKTEQQIIKPAVQGTRSVLQACLAKKVRRLIFISSCLTMGLISKTDQQCDQKCWSDPELLSFYAKSKYLAQKLCWQFYKDHPQINLSVLCPGLVLGPPLRIYGGTSQALVLSILKKQVSGIPSPPIIYSTVDVRDVAYCISRIVQNQKTIGQRYACVGFTMTSDSLFQHILQQYREKLGLDYQKVDAERIRQEGKPMSLRGLGMMGRKSVMLNKKIKEQLDVQFRGEKETIQDMLRRLQQLKAF